MLSPTARRFAFIKWTLITTFSLPLLYWFSMQPEASIVAKYKSILSMYKNGLSKYKSIVSKYQSILSKYKSMLSKYKSLLSKYKSLLSKCKFYFQSKYKATFGTLATESPKPGTFLIPRIPGTRFPEPVPSKPWEQNLTRRNSSNTETFETSGTQPSEPKTLAMPRIRNPVSRKLNPEPWNSKTCRNHRNA